MQASEDPRRSVELREMTAPVANPRHDRRRRHGNDAVPELPVGARFVLTTWDVEGDIPGVQRRDRHAAFSGRVDFRIEDAVHRAAGTEEWRGTRETLLAMIIRNSVPVAATSWRETCATFGLEGPGLDARVLERLYRSADPSVLAAMRAALAAEAAED